jgi:hypothetical protein
MTGHEEFVVDLDAYPAASFGALRFDVPRQDISSTRHELRSLFSTKRKLRSLLEDWSGVGTAYLLLVSNGELGEAPKLTVGVETDQEVEPLFRRWQALPRRPPMAFFRLGDDALSAFARAFAQPFYPMTATVTLPEIMADSQLTRTIRALPDVPHLAATATHLKTLGDEHEANEVLRELRDGSTHRAAREMLLRCLDLAEPFSLLLRTFDREVASGKSLLTGGDARLWISHRALEEHVARVTPLPLIGIANPRDPFPPTSHRLLEVGDNWLEVVVSLVAKAAAVFVVCDRQTEGISTELMVVDRLQREEHTLIIVPEEDSTRTAGAMHFLAAAAPLVPLQPQVLIRRLAGFGTTVTATQFLQQPPYGG